MPSGDQLPPEPEQEQATERELLRAVLLYRLSQETPYARIRRLHRARRPL